MNGIIPNRARKSRKIADALAVASSPASQCRAPGPATRRPLILAARSSFMLNSSRKIGAAGRNGGYTSSIP